MKIEIPVNTNEKHLLTEVEEYLQRNVFPFTKKKTGGVNYYTITIEEPVNAFWIGCNVVSITNELLK